MVNINSYEVYCQSTHQVDQSLLIYSVAIQLQTTDDGFVSINTNHSSSKSSDSQILEKKLVQPYSSRQVRHCCTKSQDRFIAPSVIYGHFYFPRCPTYLTHPYLPQWTGTTPCHRHLILKQINLECRRARNLVLGPHLIHHRRTICTTGEPSRPPSKKTCVSGELWHLLCDCNCNPSRTRAVLLRFALNPRIGG